jgi:hypothetical protein
MLEFMRRRAVTVVILLGLAAAACADDTGGATTVGLTSPPTTTAATTTTTVAPTTTTVAPTTTFAPSTTTTTAPPPAELPVSGVTASISDGYFFGGQTGEATDADLPFALGSVEAQWYSAGDFYAVVYDGLDLDATGPLCPGNSILTNTFEFISNAPTPGADCTGAPTIAAEPHGVYLCESRVAYLTMIPVGTAGTGFASVEIYGADGVHRGASSAVEIPDPTVLPTVEVADLSC